MPGCWDRPRLSGLSTAGRICTTALHCTALHCTAAHLRRVGCVGEGCVTPVREGRAGRRSGRRGSLPPPLGRKCLSLLLSGRRWHSPHPGRRGHLVPPGMKESCPPHGRRVHFLRLGRRGHLLPPGRRGSWQVGEGRSPGIPVGDPWTRGCSGRRGRDHPAPWWWKESLSSIVGNIELDFKYKYLQKNNTMKGLN